MKLLIPLCLLLCLHSSHGVNTDGTETLVHAHNIDFDPTDLSFLEFEAYSAIEMCDRHKERTDKNEKPGFEKFDKFIRIISISLLIPILMIWFTHKQLMYHPKRILFFCILFDSAYLINFEEFYDICDYKNSWSIKLLRGTLLDFLSNDSLEKKNKRALGIIYMANWMGFTCIRLVITLISIMFCLDLIKTIKSPFDDYIKRTNRMWRVVSGLGFLFLVYIYTLEVVNLKDLLHSQKKAMESDEYYLFIKPVVSFAQIIEILICIYSLSVAFYGLCLRKGFNNETRRLIFTRQIFFVMIRIFMGFFDVVKSLWQFYNNFMYLYRHQTE